MSFAGAICTIIAGALFLAIAATTPLFVIGGFLLIAGIAIASCEFYEKWWYVQTLTDHLKIAVEENLRLIHERISEVEEEITLIEKDLLSPHRHRGIPELPPLQPPKKPTIN